MTTSSGQLAIDRLTTLRLTTSVVVFMILKQTYECPSLLR